MDLLLLLLLLGGGIAFVASRSHLREQARERRETLESLTAVKTVAEEDVTRLGEDVALLDTETAGRQLDDATRQDYRRALDAYDAAKLALERVQHPEDIRGVTEILEDGRYAVACVQARLAGRPVPTRRPPCFFNPQHGPSSENVDWAPPGGVPRSVPACPADAERVLAGAEPDVRKVPVGAGRQPYWQGGAGYGGYAQGYFSPFAMTGLLPGFFLGSMLSGGFGGGDGSYSDGYQDGAESAQGEGGDAGGDAGDSGGDWGGDGGGGADGGGSDFAGGSDWGGGFGGGDFGGGDFGGGDF